MALGSGIRKLPLPDPGFKKGTGSGFATLVKSKVSSLTFQVMFRFGITELKW